ncbi:unnamed protein product [Tetraodon nigroviridis]|uniref:(spotted green pufferfish) hypothetical protein n=1 Tax=Tetraodon nigroviridis TaxID=99883 RepID=Q4SLY8_TETNG|nr:unnamed protein product [Tetraodon nigroviridis]
MEGKQHMLFRQNSNSSKERTPHATPVKQGFRLYSKSPGVSSATAAPAVAVGKPRSGVDDASTQPGSPVYLAVPKPVYGHNPCCSELCFGRGQYCVESGFPRLSHPVYKHNWMQSDAQYGDGAAVQKKAQEALLQHRALRFDAGAEQLKRMETFGPGRVRPLPPIINPNYSSYPCTFFGSFPEQRQQNSPRAYPNLFPSHHAYEHMTSEVYQEHSPMTKYGHVTQHPVFYYSQADMEVENKSRCKNSGSKPREESPVTVKHTLPSPQEHFLVPRPLHGQAALPHFQHRALLPGFGYPCYGAPRFHVDARQSVHPSLVVPSNSVHFPPANLCPDHHIASATSLHEDGARLGAGRPDANLSFIRVDQGSPPSRSDQPVPAPGVTVNRLFHPPSRLNRPGLQVPGLNVERFLPYFPGGGQVRCPKLPGIHPTSLGSELQPSLHHQPDPISKAAPRSNVQTNVCFSSVKTESKADDTAPSVPNCLKRSPPRNIKEERDWEEDEPLKKWKKMEGTETAWVRSAAESPPMPVIDNVFSLAPYQALVQPPGAPLPGRSPHSPLQSEKGADQMQSVMNARRKDPGENQPLDCRVSKENRAGSPAQTSPGTQKPPDIKVEKEASDGFAVDSGDGQGSPTTRVKPRELLFNEEVKSVFQELLKRLKEYTSQERCPFPHVMRTSTVFLPMLVLKELLFPMVQSSFIDQVLQEHRVELRPTTLSEEKILLQLHKRACSSRLRKLMSLKHLPDIYADMVNILYYTCISKHLATKPAAGAKNPSGVILKLRRMFSSGLNRKKARYQAVLDSRMLQDRPPSQTEDGESTRRTAKLTHRWQRTQSFCHALRPISRSSKRPLLKIKYCPYLSACYGVEHRRRWVLRSAVQRARSVRFPDLVGKRIRHLYEEDDKSEVWYRGEVLRVHEAHANPLKTIFEVRYDSEPEWRYYLELLIDYKKGWLKIED